jgi:hypothetical protein
MALPQSAKVIRVKDLDNDLDDEEDVNPQILEDLGRYAAAKGYDAMYRKRSDGTTWWIILNRSALYVETENTAPTRGA